MRTANYLFALITSSIIAMSGCMQTTPIPGTARAGETITLGVGGINRNWQGQEPKNLHITITDAAQHSYTLTPSSVFQAYPDYSSTANIRAVNGTDGYKLVPYDGAWFIAVPLTDANANPLNLAVGSASVKVTADNLVVALDDNGNPFSEGNVSNLPIEIVAGTPANNYSATQFSAYRNRGTHFLVRPTSTPAAVVGGAYYVINYQSDANFGPAKPIVFPVSHNPFVKMDYKLQQNADGSGSYSVYIYNPSGFTAATPRLNRQASLQDLNVQLEYFNTNNDAWMKTNVAIDQAKSYYIDLNGNKISGLSAEIRHSSDL